MPKLNDADNELIRNDFVRGVKNEDGALAFPDCEQLAKKYGLSGQAVRTKCKKEDWRSVRHVFQIEAAAQADAIFREKMVGELAKVDLSAFSVAVQGIKKVEEGLAEIPAKDARSVNAFAVALRVFQDIAHRAAGKTGKDFASILKYERKTSIQDEKATVDVITQAILAHATDVADVNKIILALEKADEGAL